MEACGRALRVVGAGGAGGRAGAAIEHYFLLFCEQYGSMWGVGAVGVLEERNACGRWVWGEGGKRACGGGGEGGGGGVRAVRDVRAVRAAVGAVRVGAGGAAGRAGAAIEHYFLFSFL